MIIKARKQGEQWRLIDNARDVDPDHKTHHFTSEREMEMALCRDDIHPVRVFSRGVDPGKGLYVNVIYYTVDNKRHALIFDRIAYITNDYGKTIEKVIVDHPED